MGDNETLDKIIAEAIDEDKLQFRDMKGRRTCLRPGSGNALYGMEEGDVRQWADMSVVPIQVRQGGRSVDFVDHNGQKILERAFKDGKLITAVVWKPNGEKCPDTNFVNGNGVMVECNDDGTEMFRSAYKDGEDVKD